MQGDSFNGFSERNKGFIFFWVVSWLDHGNLRNVLSRASRSHRIKHQRVSCNRFTSLNSPDTLSGIGYIDAYFIQFCFIPFPNKGRLRIIRHTQDPSCLLRKRVLVVTSLKSQAWTFQYSGRMFRLESWYQENLNQRSPKNFLAFGFSL